MIEGMVERWRTGWRAEGGPPEDWAQLIRSLGVLGRARGGGRDLAPRRARPSPAIRRRSPLLAAAARDAGLAP